MNGILLNQGGAGAVESVNGYTGEVTLSAADLSSYTIEEVNELLNNKAESIQELKETELNNLQLNNNNPVLFKITGTEEMFVDPSFSPYFVYALEKQPLVDGATTNLFQYKILQDGIYYRTGRREPAMPGSSIGNVWKEWEDINKVSIEDISNNYITKNEDSGAINIGVNGVFSVYPYSVHMETGTNHFSMNEDNGLQYNTISSYDFDMYYEDINKHHKLSEKADKTYVDSKLSSVYRYKGTKDYYSQLPAINEIGDVYNIKYASGAEDTGYHITVKSKGVSSKEDSSTFITVLVDETSDEYADFLERYTLTRITIGENSNFSYTGNCEGSTIIFYREDEDDSTWEEKHYGISHLFAEGNDIKVISETLWNKTDCIVNNGDNVVWTGEEWDILAGVIDLSTYVTNDNVVNSINGKKGDVTLKAHDLYNHFIVNDSQLYYNSMPGELLKFSEGGLEISGPPGLLDITLTAIDGATFETTTHKLSEKANQSYVEELEARIEALTARVAALEGN